jgi:predicted RNA-binding Zn-ribbon protein involved in translation (DUF1610 family)
MTLLGRKPAFCSVCKKEITHKHKPKNEWQMEGPLCGDCYVSQMKKFYEQSLKQKCVNCGIEKDVPDLWEPRYQWDMKGLLCKSCFNKKDEEYKNLKEFCNICGKKLGMIRYNPKKKWSIAGQLCRDCWDSQKARLG